MTKRLLRHVGKPEDNILLQNIIQNVQFSAKQYETYKETGMHDPCSEENNNNQLINRN